MLNRSSVRSLLKSQWIIQEIPIVGGDVQILNGFHPKSTRQSCRPRMWRFFYSVSSGLSLSPALLRVVSGPIRAMWVQSPWIYFFKLHSSPCCSPNCTSMVPHFEFSGCECLKRLVSN